jgi:hypothetical protein
MSGLPVAILMDNSPSSPWKFIVKSLNQSLLYNDLQAEYDYKEDNMQS